MSEPTVIQTNIDRILRQKSSSPCECPTCSTSRAITTIEGAVADLHGATNAWLERSCDDEGSLYYLRDEVERIAKMSWAWPVRKQLFKALGAVK